MSLFGRKHDAVLEHQRAAFAQFMRTVGELEDRIRSTEAFKAKYGDVWQHDDRIAQYKRGLELIHGIADVQSKRLKMATSAIPNFDGPLLAALDRIDATFTSMDDLIADLLVRRASVRAGHADFGTRPEPKPRHDQGDDADEEESGRTPPTREGEVIAWVSRAMKHASNQRPFRHDVAERDHDRLLEIGRANRLGERLAAEDFPKMIFGAPLAEEKDYRVPDLFYAYGFWIVSEAAANVLRQFDLGRAQLVSVPVLKNDHRTPIGGNWFCINFGNAKAGVVPDQSEKIRMGAQDRYILPVTIKDNQLAVSAEALQGPDIWVDPQLWDNFFVSGALGRALRKAKADKGFFLTKCRVV